MVYIDLQTILKRITMAYNDLQDILHSTTFNYKMIYNGL